MAFRRSCVSWALIGGCVLAGRLAAQTHPDLTGRWAQRGNPERALEITQRGAEIHMIDRYIGTTLPDSQLREMERRTELRCTPDGRPCADFWVAPQPSFKTTRSMAWAGDTLLVVTTTDGHGGSTGRLFLDEGGKSLIRIFGRTRVHYDRVARP